MSLIQSRSIKTYLGYMYGVAYCLMTAISVIYIHQLNQKISPLLLELGMFIISAAFFHLWNWRRLTQLYKVCFQEKKSWFLVNLWTAVTWLGTFYALDNIDAVLFIALFMGGMPVVTYIIACLRGVEAYSAVPIFFRVLIFSLMVVLIIDSMYSRYIHNEIALFLGCCYTFLGVLGAALYLIDTKQLQSAGSLTNAQLLAIRFFLLITICLVWTIFNQSIYLIGSLPYLQLIILALLTSILPLYCMQASLEKIGVIKLSFLLSLTPVFTYLLMLLKGEKPHAIVGVTLLLLTLVLIIYGKRNSFAS